MGLLLSALFRAGFEPLSWRRHRGPSLRFLVVQFSWVVSQARAAAQNRRGLALLGNPTLGAPSFSPYRSRVPSPTRPHARAPIRPIATSSHRGVAHSPVHLRPLHPVPRRAISGL